MAIKNLFAKTSKAKTSKVVKEPASAPPSFNLLLDDGTRVSASANQRHAFRAQGDDGKSYDHVHNAIDGEWVYRLVR